MEVCLKVQHKQAKQSYFTSLIFVLFETFSDAFRYWNSGKTERRPETQDSFIVIDARLGGSGDII